MLAAIGLILIIKQLPHAVGYDGSFQGDESYMNETAVSSFQDLFLAFGSISISSGLITLGALLILILWETAFLKRISLLKLIPSPLVAVSWGIGYNLVAIQWFPAFSVSGKHLVSLPTTENLNQFIDLFMLPDISFLSK